MTQLYVGNLSAEGDEKAIRSLFGKYGAVREVLMKNGYSFVEYESSYSAEEAIRALNGSDILGHPMIVEPSHQQRLSTRRKMQYGRVEVADVPPHISPQTVEVMMSQFGPIIKMEVTEEGEFSGFSRMIITYENHEQAQRAAASFKDEHTPRVTYIDNGAGGIKNGRKGSPGIPSSPSKNNSDFPLRILVPSDMVGAIIGKDGATIRMITQLTKARVDVHRRENLGSAEKAITIIGPPECCTEACYQIMKIMQNELLMTSGMLENGKYHEPLPVVPLKVLAHNELVGRVIGKGGNTLKRIMAESGTKITISKLKDLTAYNMERTITILGTIDNCKKAESLISSKLRASYESDMAQFIPEQNHVYTNQQPLSPSPTNMPSPSPLTPEIPLPSRAHPQSLPATPSATSVRTFTDFSGEHTRLTTLHGSTGALEVNNLGGFKLGPVSAAAVNGHMQTNGYKYSTMASAFESTINGMVQSNGVNGMHAGVNGLSNRQDFTPVAPIATKPAPYQAGDYDDEISDVFSGLSMQDSLIAAPGYGRMRSRRSSAPVNTNNSSNIWEEPQQQVNGDLFSPKAFSSTTLASFAGWNGAVTQAFSQSTSSASSIWSNPYGSQGGTGSRPSSQTSSYSSDHSSTNGLSPVYSPTTMGNGGPTDTTLTSVPSPDEQLKMTSAFKPASAMPTLTTVAETTPTSSFNYFLAEEDDLMNIATTAALELMEETNDMPPSSTTIQW